MSNNLVERLRNMKLNSCDEAADEIERLRKLLKKCRAFPVATIGWDRALKLFNEIDKELSDE